MSSKARELANLGNAYSDGALSNRNLIINGAMQVAQRGTSFSATSTSSEVYTLDRYLYRVSQGSKFTISQDTSVVPSGFKSALKVYVDAGYTATGSDFFDIRQPIEAQNIVQLGFGTSSAKSITVSFWVRSNVTGTFGGSIFNGSSYNYSYPFTYTISSADTWEQKEIVIPGATGGGWGTGTNAGLTLSLSLGGGYFSGTAGSWSGNFYRSATGATSMLGTTGNTFYLTGVQLEVGDTATPFEHRSYGQELALCQRYYWKFTATKSLGNMRKSDTESRIILPYPVMMRANPTLTYSITGDGGTTASWGTNDVFQIYHIGDGNNSWSLNAADADAEL